MKISKIYIAIVFLFSCFPYFVNAEEGVFYRGTIFFLNGDKKTANLEIPQARTEAVYFETEGISTIVAADSVDRIAIQTPAGNSLDFCYRHNSIRKVWVYKKCEGANVSAYIGAADYKINEDGTPHFVGISARIEHNDGTDLIPPSFPLYVARKNDKQLQLVTFIGEDYDATTFRKQISRVLRNDPILCEYLREQKWGYEDLHNIVENYNPNRVDTQLTVNGEEIKCNPQKLITDELNGEMILFVDYLHPNNKVFNIYGDGLNIGLRRIAARFFTGSVGIGYEKAQYVDDEIRRKKHPDIWGPNKEYEVASDEFSETNCFNINIFVGGQAPFHIQKFYIIPSVGWNFGTLMSKNFATEYHGLQLSFDLGYKTKYGSVLFAGLSFRQMKPVKKKQDTENWAYHSSPRFFKYPDVDAVALRIGYKF